MINGIHDDDDSQGTTIAQPQWVPKQCPREQAAFALGMSCPPFAACASMKKRVPHLSGLMLLEGLKPIYFKHEGRKAHFDFENENGQWLIERHPNNARDEDVTRDDYGDSLCKSGFCQAARADAVLKEPAPGEATDPHFRYSLSAATLIEALKSKRHLA